MPALLGVDEPHLEPQTSVEEGSDYQVLILLKTLA